MSSKKHDDDDLITVSSRYKVRYVHRGFLYLILRVNLIEISVLVSMNFRPEIHVVILIAYSIKLDIYIEDIYGLATLLYVLSIIHYKYSIFIKILLNATLFALS